MFPAQKYARREFNAGASRRLESFPTIWNHLLEKESLKFKGLEHDPIEKVEQLFRNML